MWLEATSIQAKCALPAPLSKPIGSLVLTTLTLFPAPLGSTLLQIISVETVQLSPMDGSLVSVLQSLLAATPATS